MTNPLHLDEDQIHQYFEDVYESLQAEHGFGLDPDTLDDAKRHVLLYWRKLRDRIANRVTETEVPLTLMNQRTPGNRLFSIHGVIDVVIIVIIFASISTTPARILASKCPENLRSIARFERRSCKSAQS